MIIFRTLMIISGHFPSVNDNSSGKCFLINAINAFKYDMRPGLACFFARLVFSAWPGLNLFLEAGGKPVQDWGKPVQDWFFPVLDWFFPIQDWFSGRPGETPRPILGQDWFSPILKNFLKKRGYTRYLAIT